jgi:tetraacyldisaccharide 4'-kinase
LKQRDWLHLVSGEKAGFAAAIVRLLLGIAACVYSVIIHVRNLLFDKQWFTSYSVTHAGLVTSDRAQVAIPVISVGNITVGGTGKTPMVMWLCNFLRTKDIKCVILTRGYKSAKGENDEPAILARNCPDAVLVVNPDRLAGAIEAVKRHWAQVMIMDDGFQHRRLHRDVDIVTIDSTLPFGFNRILPAGLLREPVSSLKRAHAAILTRCDLVPKDDLIKLEETIKGIKPDMFVAWTIHAPVCARGAGNKEISLERMRGKKVFAFCGIANPDAFFATIESLGVNLVGSKIYNDHHSYTAGDVNEICQEAGRLGADFILTTEKDFDKITLPPDSRANWILVYLAVELKFIEGRNRISQLIERSLAGKIPRKRTV